MKKPVVLVVMDGVGESSDPLGNMVMKATTPTLDDLKANDPFRIIKAHGTAVGLPTDDDMGNSGATAKSATTRWAADRSTARAPSWSTNPSRAARSMLPKPGRSWQPA